MWRGYVAALSTTQRARIAEDPVLSAAQSAQCSLHKRAGLDVDVQVGAERESCFMTMDIRDVCGMARCSHCIVSPHPDTGSTCRSAWQRNLTDSGPSHRTLLGVGMRLPVCSDWAAKKELMNEASAREPVEASKSSIARRPQENRLIPVGHQAQPEGEARSAVPFQSHGLAGPLTHKRLRRGP